MSEKIESEIQAKGLTAPRVTLSRINRLLDRVTYSVELRPLGSTSTLVHAFLDDDFYLATGHSACVSAENFDAELGERIATANARQAAERKLWELEGYALHRVIRGEIDADAMTFGDALTMLKAGYRVARIGWNGKGMWLSLSPGSKALPAERFWSPHNRKHAEENGPTDVLPCITMKTATGEILMGWLASQTDMLAEDWVVLGD